MAISGPELPPGTLVNGEDYFLLLVEPAASVPRREKRRGPIIFGEEFREVARGGILQRTETKTALLQIPPPFSFRVAAFFIRAGRKHPQQTNRFKVVPENVAAAAL